MKYGQHLLDNIAPQYGADAYLDYSGLDHVIRVLSGYSPASVDEKQRDLSLSTPPPTNARGLPSQKPDGSLEDVTEEYFCRKFEAELARVETFTLSQVTALRHAISQVEEALVLQKNYNQKNQAQNNDKWTQRTDQLSEDFLRLEKYVNINFMGFHKILKKHDKYLPHTPCKSFYVARMHAQAWVRGDYSDVVVRMSQIYTTLRDEDYSSASLTSTPPPSPQETTSPSPTATVQQRSIAKYWIKTEDVSRVKYAVLRHLPVMLQKKDGSTGQQVDSVLTNSVYLDNAQLEFYHGRLDKAPGASELRLRWFGGANDPNTVYVERKTYMENFVSNEERFKINEAEVQNIMTNTYPIEGQKLQVLEDVGEKEADEWENLVREVTQVISSKQLVPTMRTQYMRTAFQIPFDNTVRATLDTNLCMISERGYDLKDNTVWHRDADQSLAPNEITRFPHAILEIRLELKGANSSPPIWVQELVQSGLLYEVHKFSKDIHGCATLLPEDVRSVPYWVDDPSLRDSIVASGGRRILALADDTEKKKSKKGHRSTNSMGSKQFSLKDLINVASSPAPSAPSGTPITKNEPLYSLDELEDEEIIDGEYEETACFAQDTCAGWLFPCLVPSQDSYMGVLMPPPGAGEESSKIEPKLYFANERTFLHWLHAGVTLYTLSSAMLAFSTGAADSWAHFVALAMLPMALGFCIYALNIFLWRSDHIRTGIPGRWDDPRGPMILGAVMVTCLTLLFFGKVYQIYHDIISLGDEL